MTDPWQFDEGRKARRYWAFRRKFRLRDVLIPFGLAMLVAFLPILVRPDPWRAVHHPFAAFWIWTGWLLCTTLMPPGRVLGYQVEEDGLRCRRSFRRSQLVPWERITGVDLQSDHAVVETLDGPIRLAEPVWMWQELAEQIRAKLAEASAPVDELPVGQVAAWLGIAEDGRLRAGYPDVHHSRDARRLLARMLLPILPMLLPLLMFLWLDGHLRWLVLAPFLAMVLVELPLIAVALRSRLLHMPVTLEADVRGLTLRAGNGRARFHPWAGLHSIRREKKVVYFLTERGRFMLPANWPGLDAVIAAAERVIAERDAGRVVPRMEGLPEAGLSRAEIGVAVDRGLSRGDAAP